MGRTGNDLHYRGYDIADLAAHCEFEEVAYLLLRGKLPNATELAAYKQKLTRLRGLPANVYEVLEQLPAATHPMDVLRTGVSALGCTLPEKDDHNPAGAIECADVLLATIGSMLLYWHHYSRNGQSIDVDSGEDTLAGHFLVPASRRAPEQAVDSRHAGLVSPLRRARVQRLHLYRPRHRRHRLRHLLLHHRRDRRAARTQARRSQ